MSANVLHPWRLSLFAALSILDFYLTSRLVRVSDGHVYESNPVANAWLSQFGWIGLAAFKALCVCVVIVSVAVISVRRPLLGRRILSLGCGTVAAVVIYSSWILSFFGTGFHTIDESFVQTTPAGRATSDRGFMPTGPATFSNGRRLVSANFHRPGTTQPAVFGQWIAPYDASQLPDPDGVEAASGLASRRDLSSLKPDESDASSPEFSSNPAGFSEGMGR